MDTLTIKVKYPGSDEELSVPISEIKWETVIYIDASDKKINDITWIQPCPKLVDLILSKNNLNSLDGLPEELPELQHLDISYNNLISLEGLPKKLPNLQLLVLKNVSESNSCARIVNNILHSSIEYDISCHNKKKLRSLKGLPKELPKLHALMFQNNKLNSLDCLPQKMPYLMYLDLCENNLTSLEGLPQELPNLQHLNISWNNISSLKEIPQKMPKLQKLFIRFNGLNSLEGMPHELSNLEFLDIDNNNLSSLDNFPQNIPNITFISLWENNLSSLSGLPQDLPNLSEMHIEYNPQLKTLPNFLINYRNLQRLHYDGLELELEPRMRRWLNRLKNRHIGTTTQVYGNSQNVHDSSIQETVRQSMRRLLDQENIPKHCLDTLRNQIVQDNILTPKSKSQLLEYIQSEEELYELCLTYSDLLWVVWHTMSRYEEATQVEIKNILNQELQDSDCKCFTGRMTRLVNCLNGFCDLVEVKILDSAQIGNILVMIRERLEASDSGYSLEKHCEAFKEEMTSRGESEEVIDEWLEYIV